MASVTAAGAADLPDISRREPAAQRVESDRNQGGAVDELERNGQMGVDHLADVCHEKKFTVNMLMVRPLSTQRGRPQRPAFCRKSDDQPREPRPS